MSNQGMNTLRAQFEDMGQNVWTIPNVLSMLRIIAIPFFVYFFVTKKYLIAVLVILISGLTDLFDGKIARRFNQISKLGKLLDPAADKLTQITVTVVYFREFNQSDDKVFKIFSYVFLLFILKEFTMIVGSFVLLSMDIVPQAAIIYGKVATATFYIVMGLLMLFAPGFGALAKFWVMPRPVIIVLVCISAFLTLAAFTSYIPDVVTRVKARRENLKKSNETEE
ncbi:MAG: CDP-alcohol phosphatidyltransferase family protein [Oscillospiraceae bacterium]|nr:CDP-alcohol phosphatidyltransferase family protein [Candidatus Limimonas egerieequi]